MGAGKGGREKGMRLGGVRKGKEGVLHQKRHMWIRRRGGGKRAEPGKKKNIGIVKGRVAVKISEWGRGGKGGGGGS